MPVMNESAPHLSHDDLVLHYYGDAGRDAARLDVHLTACADCRAALDHLTRTLALMDAPMDDDLDAGFEARVWARLSPALETPAPWWRRLLDGSSSRWSAVAAAAAVVLAFAGGWQVRDTTAPTTSSAVAPALAPAATAASPSVQTRVLVVAVGDHLDRAEVVLSELLNADGPLGDERERAADLVATNRLYRQTAVQAGDDAMDEVLDEIERVLVEVANAPADVSANELTALRQRVESRGILFRVRVLGNELRARQQQTPDVPAMKGKTS
jgi:hypothetical protein